MVFTTINCTDDITKPAYTNPLDPKNPETQGDPFHLQAVVGRWDVTLTWSIPSEEIYIQDYVVYRSEQAYGNYSIISDPQTIKYYQTYSSYSDPLIQYDKSYWYKVTVRGASYRESSLNTITSLRVDVPSLETGTLRDIDGNIYNTVKIGDQWWTVQNLEVTHYRNGDAIPNVTDNNSWKSLTTGAFCNYNNDVNQTTVYGRMYNWYAVVDSRCLAPTGWHVPSDDEWKQLEIYIGIHPQHADIMAQWRGAPYGGRLKEAGTAHWNSPNTDANNKSGFSALPGGNRDYYGFFFNMGSEAYFWSSTEGSGDFAWYRGLDNNDAGVNRDVDVKHNGFSVRCLRD